MDNEEPWQPPEHKKFPDMPKITPQVPEVTLFSPSNNIHNNFIQRGLNSERNILNFNKKPSQNHPTIACMPLSKPLLPDISILEQPKTINRTNPHHIHQKFVKSATKENITTLPSFQAFHNIPKPSVPDVTIFDEEPKRIKSAPCDRIFNESYKNMLISSHDQFIKQMEDSSNIPTQQNDVGPPKRRSGLFSKQQKTINYQENPLKKYNPKPQPVNYEQKDGNSSSILIDIDNILPITSAPASRTSENEEKTDEMTFKKVAEMLSEIQKLVVPDDVGKNNNDNVPSKTKQHEIIRKLATSYLTQDEYIKYEINQELEEMENEDFGT